MSLSPQFPAHMKCPLSLLSFARTPISAFTKSTPSNSEKSSHFGGVTPSCFLDMFLFGFTCLSTGH